MDEQKICVEVVRCGVVQLPGEYCSFSVNGENVMEEVRAAIEKYHPKSDSNGNFAGRVTIVVELLGDLEKTESEA